MNILVIPTTDWTRHPVPNRLNFIFDRIAERHNVDVLHFNYSFYKPERDTKCNLIDAGTSDRDISKFYVKHYRRHKELIRKTIKENNIDVILSANILPSHAATHFDVPIVYDYLDVMDESAGAYLDGVKKPVGEWFVRRIVKKNIQNAKEVITVSPSLAQYHVVNRYGKNIQNTVVIPNGVDCDIFKPYPREEGRKLCRVENELPIVGYVGSIERWVDLDMAIKAMNYIHANLVIIGTSLHTYEMEVLKRRAKSLGDRVIFLGRVPYNRLPQFISGFDVGINPLYPSEHNIYSAGGKIFNYLACGVPVVSSECDPGALVKDKLYIYNTPDEYVNKLFVQLTQLLPQNRAVLPREDLVQVARHFCWDTLARKYEEVLERVAKS